MTDLVTTETAPLSARRAATRAKLMAAASQVFAARGVIGATVEEICEAAGFTRGAFYSNFPDKDALVLALIQQHIAAGYEAAERAIDTARPLVGRHDSEQLVDHVLRQLDSTAPAGRESVLTEQELLLYTAREPRLREPYLAFVAECARQLATLIDDALQFCGLRFTLPFDQAVSLLMAAHTQMQVMSLFTGEQDSAALRRLVAVLTEPVAGPTGEPSAAAALPGPTA